MICIESPLGSGHVKLKGFSGNNNGFVVLIIVVVLSSSSNSSCDIRGDGSSSDVDMHTGTRTHDMCLLLSGVMWSDTVSSNCCVNLHL